MQLDSGEPMKTLLRLQYIGLVCALSGVVWLMLQSSEAVINEARQSAAWLMIFGGTAWFGVCRFMRWLIEP